MSVSSFKFLCPPRRLQTLQLATYLKVRWNNDFAGWYLKYNGLSFKKPEIPLGVIGQQGPGQQLNQQSV